MRTTINDLLERARARLARLTPETLVGAVEAGALMIDTRTPTDREREGVIPGSAHFPRTVLEWRVDATSGYGDPLVTGPDQHLVVICNEGYSSSLAAATLQDLGFHRATDLDGGFRRWRAEGWSVHMPGPQEHTFSDEGPACRAPVAPLVRSTPREPGGATDPRR